MTRKSTAPTTAASYPESLLLRKGAKSLVGAGHVILQIFIALGGMAKYQITCFHFSRIATAMLDYISFLSCLEIALLNSVCNEIVLKPKQVLCLESVYLDKDVMCVLPTGFGKSLIFHLLPMFLFAKHKLNSNVFGGWNSNLKSITAAVVDSIIIVVPPLDSLLSDQISRLRMSGIEASVIGVKGLREQMASSSDDEDM